MQNSDLIKILPYLTGGNKDLSGILSAMGKGAPNVPPAAAPSGPPPAAAPKYPDYTKLYPNNPPPQQQNSAPSGGSNMDLAAMLQLVAAMKSTQSSPAPPREPEVAPTATREIRASLRSILDLNALASEEKPPKSQN